MISVAKLLIGFVLSVCWCAGAHASIAGSEALQSGPFGAFASFEAPSSCLSSIINDALAGSAERLQAGETVASLAAGIVTAIEDHLERSSVQFPCFKAPDVHLPDVHRKLPQECGKKKDPLRIEAVWPNVIMVVILLTCAATAAGLTVGMLSIEPLECVIKMRSGDDAERKQAARILPVIERHHLLLSTLMLFNSIANEVRNHCI
jgi:Cyclin M transmembrane N-terminal domain